MRKHFLLILSLALLAGCAARPNLENTESSTGLGSSPFSTGGRFTAANANAINNAVNDNDTRLDTIEALTGPVYSDGDGTYTDMSVISSTELGYLNGVTSAIQTQFGNKLNVATVGTDSVVQTYSDGVKTFNVSLETPDHINDDSALSFGVQSSPLKFYLADDPTLGGTRAYLWSTSVTLPMLPHTGIRPTFAVYGDILVGDIIALESNPMTYFMRANLNLDYTDITQLFSARYSTSDTDGGALIGLSPLQNAGGAVSDGNISIVAYGIGTGSEGNSITLANRSGVDTASGRWLMDGQASSGGDWRPMADNTYSIGSASYQVKEVFAKQLTTASGVSVIDASTGYLDSDKSDPPTTQTLTVNDSGDGNPATGTVTFTTNIRDASTVVNCADADGCPMTMSETGAIDGMRLRVFSSTSSAGDMSFITSAGVQAVRSTRTLEPGESVEFEYRTDYWDEISESTEPGVSAPGSDGDFVVNSSGAFGALTIATLSQADAEDDTDTTYGFITGERLGQAITAWMATYRGTEDSPLTAEPAQANLYIGLTVWADGDQWQPAGVSGVHEVQCIELGNPATWIALRSAGGDVYLDVPRYVKASSTLNDTTTPHALTDGEMLNHTISNYGDSADQTYSIPVYSTAVGWDVEFFMGAAYDMIIAPSGSSNWYLDGVARTAGQYITNASPAVGESVACKDKYNIIWCTSTGTGWAWETGASCDLDSDAQVFAFATLDSNQTVVDAAGNWRGEAFTLAGAQDLTGFQIYAVDLSSDTGTITCELKAYDFGTDAPTGSVLATTGALASSTMPNTSQQFFFPFTAVYSASASDYCVYCYGSSGGTIGIRRVASGTEDVANAQYIYSYDSGSTWGFANYDVRGDGVFGCAP